MESQRVNEEGLQGDDGLLLCSFGVSLFQCFRLGDKLFTTLSIQNRVRVLDSIPSNSPGVYALESLSH